MWDLSEIIEADPVRGSRLVEAPTESDLRRLLLGALEQALIKGRARLGAEQSSNNPKELRAVVQFWVGSTLFDWFFNGPNGYRAQFRANPETGRLFNQTFIFEARRLLVELLPPVLTVRALTPRFGDAGSMQTTIRDWTRSLDPALSNVWMTGLLIQSDGSQPTSLPLGMDGARIDVGLPFGWMSVSRTDADAWLDIKGAFVGPGVLYQPTDPVERAQRLHTHGEA